MKTPGARKIAGRPGRQAGDVPFAGRYFLCEPLAATISVAQCRANRARPVERGAGEVRGHLRPGPCTDCALAVELEAGKCETWTLAERIAQVQANGGAGKPPEAEPVERNPWGAAREIRAKPARGEFHEAREADMLEPQEPLAKAQRGQDAKEGGRAGQPLMATEKAAEGTETAKARGREGEPTMEERTRFLGGHSPKAGLGPTARILAVLEWMRDPITVAQIAALADHDQRLTGILLVELGKRGRIERVARGLYRGRGGTATPPTGPSPPAAAGEGEKVVAEEAAQLKPKPGQICQPTTDITHCFGALREHLARCGDRPAGDTRSLEKVAEALRAGREQGTPAGDIGRCIGALREHLARCGDRPALEMLERIERMSG